MEQLHEDLWVASSQIRFLGLVLDTRMTVVRFGGDLLLHSPIPPTDALRHQLADLGRVRWVVAPNSFHHLYLAAWIALGAEPWGVPAVARKRKDIAFTGMVGGDVPWSSDLQALATRCIPFTDEAVFHHRPSGTLIVSDLLFNLPPTAHWLTRSAMRLALGYPGVCCTLLERMLIHRLPGRQDLGRMLEWKADRIILAHGDVVESGGVEALQRAYAWLLRPPALTSPRRS